jgi:cytochrome c-type biogenesis protein CcsB
VTLEIVVTWIALTFYAAAAAMSVIGVIFSKQKLTDRLALVCGIGLAFQAASLGIRWVRVGHGPYLGFYEVASALVFFTIAAFVVASWRNPRLAGAGIGIMPIALLLMGGSMLAQGSDMPMTAKLASWWLFVHVAFANLAFGAFALSFGCAIVYVVRARSADGRWAKRFEKLPAQDVLENYTVRFVLVGFLFWALMITTGAIWANEAWGRYWGWDPIETWSLIVWIIYAVYLHVRFALKWNGERLAWFAIAAMPLALFALIGIPLAFNTPHAGIGGYGKDL